MSNAVMPMMAQNVIVFQPEFGVSGDMILSSLIDLLRIDISPDSKFLKILNDIARKHEKTAVVKPEKVKSDELQGIKINVDWEGGPGWDKPTPGLEIRKIMEDITVELGMNHGKDLALNTIDTIIEAE